MVSAVTTDDTKTKLVLRVPVTKVVVPLPSGSGGQLRITIELVQPPSADPLDDADHATESPKAQEVTDPWTEAVRAYLADHAEVTSADILDALGVDQADRGPRSIRRVAHLLRCLGWRQRSIRRGDKVRRMWVAPPS